MNSSEEFKKLKRTRGAHRRSAKKIIDELETDLMASPDLDLVKIAQLKRSLEEKVETLKQLDNEIIDILEDEDERLRSIRQEHQLNGL